VQDHQPWLSQGDIFERVPVLDLISDDAGQLQPTLPLGPALLLTHGCAMDKPDSDGRPRVDWLQFTRLRAIDALPAERKHRLRSGRGSLGPYDVMYLGEVGHLGESFIFLSEPYHLPATYFDLTLDGYTGHADAEPDAKYVTPNRNDTRSSRLDDLQVDFLHKKMLAFWARVTTG
jgi:hypothetical protein